MTLGGGREEREGYKGVVYPFFNTWQGLKAPRDTCVSLATAETQRRITAFRARCWIARPVASLTPRQACETPRGHSKNVVWIFQFIDDVKILTCFTTAVFKKRERMYRKIHKGRPKLLTSTAKLYCSLTLFFYF